MKKLLILLAICIAAPCAAQSLNPTVWTEADGSPRVSSPTQITVGNGSLSCVGKKCTLTTGGGSQSPWTANVDADGFNLLFDDATGIKSSETGNPSLLLFTSVASAVNYATITNAAAGGNVLLSTDGSSTAVPLYLFPKGGGYPDGPQVYFRHGARYDRPEFSWPSPLNAYGIHQNSGGGWFSINANNIALGAGGAQGGAEAVVALLANGKLAWGSSTATPIDCGPCQDLALGRGTAYVFQLTSNSSTSVNTFDKGATIATIANSPAQITADQNNYNPGAPSYFQRWNTNASRQITGLTFTNTQIAGQVHFICNVGSQDIVLVHQSASSTAANRFISTTAANITLTADSCATVLYDATTSRWRAWQN